MEIFLNLPLGWAIFALFCGAMMRSNGTYWLARGLVAGARRTRLERHLNGDVIQRARRLINRFGPFAVTLCFLTVGLQSAVIGSAGLARMPQRHFLPAVVLGSLIWAVVYATVGLAAAAAWIALLLESPAAAAVLAGAAVLAAAYVVWRRRRAAGRSGDDGGSPDAGGVSGDSSAAAAERSSHGGR
ncbi:VTT domain-containing protein [Arthrobacter sp. I2-34]|uniref:VTT domain-containing protein n=1 Tax=Arthrobacter hankyongi TaxID=2904801 RepID=A0ABS9L658_9MICC|nr:VTT domain-containing protein [Arthrobacter hankyongi]MCG2621967.1 VTT domain-containing protein [Arthrobacter hankyongi]